MPFLGGGLVNVPSGLSLKWVIGLAVLLGLAVPGYHVPEVLNGAGH